MILNKTYCGHAKEVLETFPDQSVNCCVTSPPYWGLRDYKTHDVYWPAVTYSLFGFEITVPEWTGQFGLEPDPKMFVGHMVYIFREVHRVLKNDGTLWLNLGDSYAANSKNRTESQATAKSNLSGSLKTQCQSLKQQSKIVDSIKPKDLIGIPWMVAFALREDGWYLRQDIIWSKPNPMPESVTDRCTKAHEYIFLFSKSRKYYYDAEAIKTDSFQTDIKMPDGWDTGKGSHGSFHRNGREKGKKNKSYHNPNNPKYEGVPDERWKDQFNGRVWGDEAKANKRSVWTVATYPFKDAHYATFPPDLIVDCIKAGCPVDGVVLDPFSGAGTTPLVARKLDINYVGIELNPANIEISEKRLYNELGMFK